ncbi:HAD family hydrolase [Streptomyces sp. JJ36]|uniref:HAD family hydrolase n=1 Tax=Streptomyces sp. JJ36 TaxID=2736645 RepID=UPI001F1FA659|nr:HAD family hydrolase [Streptomyces sp. JJ36]MCF6524176.1 HAD family hydrolase [Streptomyces sp. JJ36]
MDDLLRAAQTVLFDFDGPLCRLFAGHPAPAIAQRMRDLITAHGEPAALGPEARQSGDPLVVLRALEPGGELAVLLERALADEELVAARTALPTAYADRLVHTLAATGRRVAVTTNNAQEAVESYLHGRGLAHHFAGRVHGRLHDVSLLKPHPDCLRRALTATRTRPERAVMIGDTVADLEAAAAAGVPFLGFAHGPVRREALRAAGARHVVSSLEEVLTAVTAAPSFR